MTDRHELIREAELAGGLTEAELEAFDRPAREVFRESLAAAPDGAAFLEFYRQHAAEISDVGKEERSMQITLEPATPLKYPEWVVRIEG